MAKIASFIADYSYYLALMLRSIFYNRQGTKNIDEFRLLTRELEDLLNDFNSLDENDGDKIEVMLFEFHRILTTFEWHFSEISDLNMKFLKGFRKG
ncbi:hypothetical protein [Oceanobacillus alkalisoli]|uniref:hypothetical protein n=1 Tax=Oceanobacillus alkalisoli TaxID=2925113 RepID=UPI001EF0BEC8|nr:hypothetical protein [Oceanobacillus alkalisoli]MCF3943914.1 hypothetical protein [Oceanobacillus alkalisoli]MCG5104580.1 hypothetical protein [Oceanobacillus alkalisoli]